MRAKFALLALLLVSAPSWASEYYVSPAGNDAWSGRVAASNAEKTDGPFATLERARMAVRADKGGTVFLRAGTYELPGGLKLSREDSHTTWRAYEREKPVLVGGRRIGNFVPYQGQVLKADLAAQGIAKPAFKQVIFDAQRQPLARYPNFDPANPYGGGWTYVDGALHPMYADIPGERHDTLLYKAPDARTWGRPTDGEVFVFARFNWWNDILPIKEIDRATRTITTAKDASYGMRPGDRYFVQGLLEELDAPGEWYLDRQAATLYFWPPRALRPDDAVLVPTTPNVLQISGARDIIVRGLTFECSEADGVQVAGCTGARVVGCTVRNVGHYNGSGVAIANGSDNAVVGCDISFTGSSGIYLSGGDRKTLTAANNVADNNYIHHVGVYYKQGVGVSLNGVGDRASHNLIHDGPRMGIMFSGNNLVIEYNHVRHTNLETEDTGAIYTGGRDWISSRGSVIRYNYFHDMLGYGKDEKGNWKSPYFAWGVYLDDNAGGVDVIGNVVVNCPRAAIHLHSARDNLIENNVFADCGVTQIEYSGWRVTDKMWTDHFPTMVKGYESIMNEPAWQSMRNIKQHPKDAPLPSGLVMTGNVVRRNVIAYRDPAARLYILKKVPLDHNVFESNLVFAPGGAMTIAGVEKTPITWAKWQALGEDKGSAAADPQFVNPAKGDYRLKPTSPALKLKFTPIPMEKIGPYADEARASWPIVEAEGAREKPL